MDITTTARPSNRTPHGALVTGLAWAGISLCAAVGNAILAVVGIMLYAGGYPGTGCVLLMGPNVLCGLWFARLWPELRTKLGLWLAAVWSYLPLIPAAGYWRHEAEGYGTFAENLVAVAVPGTVLFIAAAVALYSRYLPRLVRQTLLIDAVVIVGADILIGLAMPYYPSSSITVATIALSAAYLGVKIGFGGMRALK